MALKMQYETSALLLLLSEASSNCIEGRIHSGLSQHSCHV